MVPNSVVETFEKPILGLKRYARFGSEQVPPKVMKPIDAAGAQSL